MVLGYHVILGAYGFWLPNDPRGSWSDFVRCWELRKFGPAKVARTRQSQAGKEHDHKLRLRAKQSLRYPPVTWTGVQARAIARGFAAYFAKSGVVVWACSIMPEHVHLVVARHRYSVEQIINLAKAAATKQVTRERVHPLAEFGGDSGDLPPRMWSRGHWRVFLNSEAALRTAIDYVTQNPIKEGKRRQEWSFVARFD
ncbi:MAG: transposase [Phycisphaerales bacterium]|nr:transposase [Phycisphaerales bacterium]